MKIIGKSKWLNVRTQSIRQAWPRNYADGYPKVNYKIPKIILPRDAKIKAAYDGDRFYFSNCLIFFNRIEGDL